MNLTKDKVLREEIEQNHICETDAQPLELTWRPERLVRFAKSC